MVANATTQEKPAFLIESLGWDFRAVCDPPEAPVHAKQLIATQELRDLSLPLGCEDYEAIRVGADYGGMRAVGSGLEGSQVLSQSHNMWHVVSPRTLGAKVSF